jgi:hypothetical protein
MRIRSRWKVGVFILLVVAGCSRSGGSGPPQSLHVFASSETPITTSGVTPAEGGWRVASDGAGSVRLFEVPAPGLEQTTLVYRARLKASDVRGKAYLEMWVRVPGRGEFFSRGLDQPLQGSSDWASYEIPFFLNEAGVRADLVKLNVAFEGGGGSVWIKDVELVHTPLG